MKILELRSENVKKIRVVSIKPDGSLVVIGGRNGQGKSSTLDSIMYALGGKKFTGSMPVRKGEDKATILIETDTGIVIRRTYTKGGGGTLTVTTKDGWKPPGSPQDVLDALVGTLSFDPLEFTRMSAMKQVETLRLLVGLDFTESDATRKQTYDRRTDVNKDVERLKSQLAMMPAHADAPAAEVSIQDIVAELQRRSRVNEQNKALRQNAIDVADLVDGAGESMAYAKNEEQAAERERDLLLKDSGTTFDREMEELQRRIARAKEDRIDRDNRAMNVSKQKIATAQKKWAEAQANRQEFEAAAKKASETAESLVDLDVAEVQRQSVDADITNRKVRENLQRADVAKKLAEAQQRSASLTESIAAIDEDKQEKLSAAKFPVEGLTFDDTGVVFNGIPFDQSSSAEQLRVSVAIGLSANPKLRVMLVRDGSLLDEDSLKLLGELAEKHDAQVWLEKCGTEGKPTVVIEDGMVVGAEVPAEEVAAK
jgi:DNA repair exonuclease SbcCD ATPase subunit